MKTLHDRIETGTYHAQSLPSSNLRCSSSSSHKIQIRHQAETTLFCLNSVGGKFMWVGV